MPAPHTPLKLVAVEDLLRSNRMPSGPSTRKRMNFRPRKERCASVKVCSRVRLPQLIAKAMLVWANRYTLSLVSIKSHLHQMLNLSICVPTQMPQLRFLILFQPKTSLLPPKCLKLQNQRIWHQVKPYLTPLCRVLSTVKRATDSPNESILTDLTMTIFSVKSSIKFMKKETVSSLPKSMKEKMSKVCWSSKESRCTMREISSKQTRPTRQMHSFQQIRSSRTRNRSAQTMSSAWNRSSESITSPSPMVTWLKNSEKHWTSSKNMSRSMRLKSVPKKISYANETKLVWTLKPMSRCCSHSKSRWLKNRWPSRNKKWQKDHPMPLLWATMLPTTRNQLAPHHQSQTFSWKTVQRICPQDASSLVWVRRS